MQINEQCKSCHGTGLYQGMCERDHAAVICQDCCGKGSVIHEYIPFEGRVIRNDIKRVYTHSRVYAITDQDVEGVNFSQYGCSYQEWLDGFDPLPIETLECPCLATGQQVKVSMCAIGLSGRGCSITGCKFYDQKAKCWKEYWQNHPKDARKYPPKGSSRLLSH